MVCRRLLVEECRWRLPGLAHALARNQALLIAKSSVQDFILEQSKVAVHLHEHIDKIEHHRGARARCFVEPRFGWPRWLKRLRFEYP